MNGAEVLIDTLENNDVEVCFANPGTSEMHLVAAIDKSKSMRPVLALFEGVVTGAADGYGRMAEKPAATLMHLGPGLANGMANLHNAKRAGTPLINIVGDHPAYHLHYDSPLTTDIPAIARNVSDWVHTALNIRTVGSDTTRTVQAALQNNGQVATLILPANVAWEDNAVPASAMVSASTAKVDEQIVVTVRQEIKKHKRVAFLLRGAALKDEGLRAAGRIAEATGARLIADTFYPRMQRGDGYAPVERLPYRSEANRAFLEEIDLLVLVGTKPPVAFFAYPGKPGWPVPESCQLMTLAHPHEDGTAALQSLASLFNITDQQKGLITSFNLPDLPAEGSLNAENIMRIVGNLLPEQAILCDESVSSGFPYYALTANSRPHDYLNLTGGAIGSMLSASAGAAIACPDRKVVCLVGDGSAMYTVQALWTIAREKLDVVVVIYANRAYAILQDEMNRMGAAGNSEKLSMLDIGNPELNWVKMAQSMGVEAVRVNTTTEFHQVFKTAVSQKGPLLIEAVI